ncbi:MAG: flagellar basal body-associated FliL family protein [Deltaproteobacteria bacterium]|nr:flagellar basal body-associated FliL family protein [Deltaproteobacteria bacterium]
MAEKKTKEAKKPAPEAEAEAPATKSVEAPAPPAKGGGKLKLVLIVVGAMVLGGVGAFAAMRFLSPPAVQTSADSGDAFLNETPVDDSDSEEPIVAPVKGEAPAAGGGHGAASGAAGEETAALEGPQTVDLRPFSTNLNESSGRSRYLKVSISMEVDGQAGVDELNRKMPDIQDKILMLLSSLSSQDVATVEGKERLRSQILRIANTYMTENKVSKVKYSEFIIQ